MRESQLLKALVIYDDLDDLKDEINSIEAVRSALDKNPSLTIALITKGQLATTLKGLEKDFSLGLISLLLDYKKAKYEKIRKDLEEIK